jgi:hypothetical protein
VNIQQIAPAAINTTEHGPMVWLYCAHALNSPPPPPRHFISAGTQLNKLIYSSKSISSAVSREPENEERPGNKQKKADLRQLPMLFDLSAQAD